MKEWQKRALTFLETWIQILIYSSSGACDPKQ